MPEISRQQKQYLARQKKEKNIILAARTLLFVLFMGLWEISSDLGWIDSFIFSSQSLFAHIAVTLAETLVSFFFVVILGVGTAVLLWCSRRIARILEPCLVVLNSLPKSALAPLLIVWLGATSKTIIIAGMSVAIFGSILNLYTAFINVDQEKIKLIYTLHGNRRHALTKVVLPSSVPAIISNMKVNIGLCLVGVIIGEFLAAKSGLGYLIIYSSQVFKMDWLLMSIILLCIMAMGLYALINVVEKRVLKKY